MSLGARRNVGTTLLCLPLSVTRNAVLSSLFSVNGGEVSANLKSDVTNNIFHHILQFIKCFNPTDLGGPKSLPPSPKQTGEEAVALP